MRDFVLSSVLPPIILCTWNPGKIEVGQLADGNRVTPFRIRFRRHLRWCSGEGFANSGGPKQGLRRLLMRQSYWMQRAYTVNDQLPL